MFSPMLHRALVLLLSLPLLALGSEAPITRIALGSCNRTDLPQDMWEPILAFKPQLWIWLGDNIYGDTEDMNKLAGMWAAQKSIPGYERLCAQVEVLGTWDDHDYGRNDAGAEYPRKAASQQLFLDFLGEPAGSLRRGREGVYDARTFGPEGRRVQVILLDVRTHRAARRSGGDILGDAQWKWLEETLRRSTADINIIASGSQILPQEHRFEKWEDYPESRARLFRTIGEAGARGVIFVTGDRHMAEISRVKSPEIAYPIYELTSSGLTHTRDNSNEPNALRVAGPFVERNFGTLEFDWEDRTATLGVRSLSGDVVLSQAMPMGGAKK